MDRNIGTLIKRVRLWRGMTQVDVARHMGIAYRTVGHYENNRTNMSLETRIRFAHALRMPEDYFIVDNYHIATEYNIRGK